MEPQRHRLFGLTIETTIPLPDLPSDSSSRPADVVIGYGQVTRRDGSEIEGLNSVGRAAILNIGEAGRYLIEDGRRIVVAPAPNASERNVRLYLLGSAFGALLHQRRLLPLHANAIDVGGTAVAFMGHSGAGKSTLAGWFHDRGFAILGDDVCVVLDILSGTPVVQPGVPRIRLWGDALRASGRVASDYQASFDDMDKYDVPIDAVPVDSALPLAAIYTLDAITDDTSSAITRLAGIEAVEALVSNTYRGGYIPMIGSIEQHLAQCVALARTVPVFALRRRWSLDHFATEAAAIEEHVTTVLSACAMPCPG